MARRKNNRTTRENYAIKREAERMEAEGLRQDRATAAAFRKWRENELDMDTASNLTTRQQRLRKAMKRNRMDIQLGAAVVDLSTLAAFRRLYRLAKGKK